MLNEQLKQKFTQEFEDYIEAVRQMSKDDLLNKVEEISAMTDIHDIVKSDRISFDEHQAKYLLSLENPLAVLRDEWLCNYKDISEGLDHVVWVVCDRELSDAED